MSDHHRIEIDTNYEVNKRKTGWDIGKENEMRMYNFFSEEIDWDVVNERMSEKIWEENLENKNATDITNELLEHISDVCKESLPKRKRNVSVNDRSKIPWERRRLFGRKKMLNKSKRKSTTDDKKKQIDKEIEYVENEIV